MSTNPNPRVLAVGTLEALASDPAVPKLLRADCKAALAERDGESASPIEASFHRTGGSSLVKSMERRASAFKRR